MKKWLFAIIVFSIAFVYVGYHVVEEARIRRCGQTTKGVVVKIEKGRDGKGRQDYDYFVEFNLGDNSVVATRTKKELSYNVGDTVRVIYLPRNPKKNFILFPGD